MVLVLVVVVVVVVTCPPMHLCHSQAISRLVGSESRIRKVEAVSSRSYFLIKSLTDLRTSEEIKDVDMKTNPTS